MLSAGLALDSVGGRGVSARDPYEAWMLDRWDRESAVEDDDGPADCPGGGIDDLCSWPDVESCGLCTLGMNPDLLPKDDRA